MGENTKIEWADHTWNPWFGCTKVSPACDHCYAEDMMDHRYGRVTWGAGEDRKRTSAQNWKEPLKWDRAARAAGRIDTVFCLSLGDIWDNEVDPLWRRDAFAVMDQTPSLLYLLLSKRIGNAVKMCDPEGGNPLLPRNAALGSTMVNQDEWDRDRPKLKEAGRVLEARFTFASVEPMLGPIDGRGDLPDWVIVGGESGTNARPMHPDWARSLRDQCAKAGTPFFFKQHGEWIEVDGPRCRAIQPELAATGHWIDQDGKLTARGRFDHLSKSVYGSSVVARVGKKRAGRLLDEREHSEFPPA